MNDEEQEVIYVSLQFPKPTINEIHLVYSSYID
jgi:hypothetical protein